MSSVAKSDRSADCQKAVRLIESGDYRAALSALHDALREDPSGASHALAALACFHLEDYAAAVEHYDKALEREPGRQDWRELRAHARANVTSKINTFVPERRCFNRDELLQPPVPPMGALPAITPSRRIPRLRRLLVALGSGLGFVCGVTFGLLTRIYGALAGYHDEVWTNWYRKPLWCAVLMLAHMREELNRHNLKDAYPKDELVGFQSKGQKPPPGVEHCRTADGSWNNLKNPMEGAAGTRFSRNVASLAIRPESGARLLTPDPREVSRRLLTRGDRMKEVPFLNLLAAAWIQFQTHDWVSHGDNPPGNSYEISLAQDDEARRNYLLQNLAVGRTQADPTRLPQGEPTPITYINEVTHWWDGSQIYGSDWQTLSRLRSGTDGKLKIGVDGRLPLAANGVEEAGFVRNWWVGLSMFHTLFVKEHNAICDRLKTKYPHWDDARLFNVARLINAAVMAKIHTIEWTPAILPNPAVNDGLNANWYGLATNFLCSREQRKTLAEVNIRNPELGGVVGNPIVKHGAPYGLTEEFVEVYRLHSLMPETLDLRRCQDDCPIERVPLAATRQAGSAALTSRVGMADLFYSFGTQHPGALVLNNYPKFMQVLSMPGNPLLDLGAVDILRARERGVPRYNEFRRQLLLKPIRTFKDLTDDEEQLRKLEEIYGGDVEDLDLLIGTLAEQSPSRRPTNFGFGETLFQIFLLNATRRLQADRFYSSCYNEETYTREGLDWIDDVDLRTVLLRHYPELAQTGLANIRNAFEPWDNEEWLDPARHPLRAFDKGLGPDPWVGERARSAVSVKVKGN
jgi:Animal haem peroxidase/Tetratricopeptide repeat